LQNVFLANGVDKSQLTGVDGLGTGDFDSIVYGDTDLSLLNDNWRDLRAWYGHDPENSGASTATALLGDFVDNTMFNANIGDQGQVLNDVLNDSTKTLLSETGVLGELDQSHIFARVYNEVVKEGGKGSADDKIPIDRNQEDDWTVTDNNTPGDWNRDGKVYDATSLNPQDPSNDDFNPLQDSDVGDEDGGQTVLFAEETGETLSGGRGPDFLYGGAGNDTLNGDAHNDFLFGGAGNDTLNGGAGGDLLIDVDGDDTLNGGTGDDILITDASVLTGYVDYALDANDDTLDGGDGDDVLIAGAGNDTLDGGDGDDVLIAGAGDDLLTGGLGADTFMWQSEETGTDTIMGFTQGPGGDVLNLADLLVNEDGSSAANLNVDGSPNGNDYLHISKVGDDTHIKIYSNGNGDVGDAADQTIILANVDLTGADSYAKIEDLLSNGNLMTDDLP